MISGSNDHEAGIQNRLFLVIHHRLTVEGDDRSTSLLDDRLGRGGVPLGRRTEPRIHVGATFGDNTEFQRTAHRHEITIAKIFNKRVETRATVRPTADDAHRARAGAGYSNSCGRLVAIAKLGTETLTTDVGLALHRYVHDTEDGLAGLNQRDVDRELAISIDEFLGAVERINEPVARPAATFFEYRKAGLLRNDRQSGCLFLEACNDAAVRCEVRLR